MDSPAANQDTTSTRRGFGKQLVSAAALPLALSSPSVADDKPAKPTVDPATATVDALVEIVRARYGKHLTDEQLKVIRQGIGRDQRSAEALKRVPLKNSDEPAFAFRADIP